MKQILPGGTHLGPSTTLTMYNAIHGGPAASWVAVGLKYRVRSVVAADGDIDHLHMKLSTAPGSGKSWAFTLYKNDVATSLTVTISGTDTEATDSSNSVAVAAGDIVYLVSSPTGTPTSIGEMSWSMRFTGDDTAASLLLGHGIRSVSGAGVFGGFIQGSKMSAAIVSQAETVCPTDGEIDQLHVYTHFAPGSSAGNGYSVTLYVNGVATALTCSVLHTDQTANDTAHAVSVSAGDKIYWGIGEVGSASGSFWGPIGARFTADVDGESIYTGVSSDAPSAVTVEYAGPLGGIGTWGSSSYEDEKVCLFEEMTLKKFYVGLSAAPGAGNDRKFTVRVNLATPASGLEVEISDSDTSGNDTSNDISLSDGDEVSIMHTPTSSPTTTVPCYWGFVGLITGAYLKSISADVGASGAMSRAAGRGIDGAISAAASVGRAAGKGLSGDVSALAARGATAVGRGLSGDVSAHGARGATAVGRGLSGDASAAGSVRRSMSIRALVGDVSAAGAVSRAMIYGKALAAAAVSAGGTIARGTLKALVAGAQAASLVARGISRGLVGQVAASGTARRSVAIRAFLASVSASATARRLAGKSFTFVVTTAASMVKRAKKNATAFAEAQASRGPTGVIRSILGGVTAQAAVRRHTAIRTFIAHVSALGKAIRNALKPTTGGVQVSASISRKVSRAVTADVAVAATAERFLYDINWLMNQTVRRIYAKARVSYTDPYFSDGVEASASETGRGTYPDQTMDNVTTQEYKWFSLHENDLSGDYHPLPANQEISVGWWSATLCSGAGVFISPPVLTITHSARTVSDLLVVGDDKLGEYPTWFVIRLYSEGDVLQHTEAVNTGSSVTWSKSITPVPDIVKQTLTITKWNQPNAVAKIAQFYTSVEQTYYSEDGDIVDLQVLEEREFVGTTIPQGNVSSNELVLRLNNSDHAFSPGNYASPLYGELLNNRAIRAWLGVDMVPSGVRVWYPLGTFYSRDWNAPEDEIWAEVRGYDALDRLKQTEFSVSEVYEDITLHDLAVIVFSDAGLTAADYNIDTALDTAAHTVAYAWFDTMSHREALRRIAAAALGQLYCDRDGIIQLVIYTVPAATSQDWEYTLDNSWRVDHPLAWSEMINSVQARAKPRTPSAEQDICIDTEEFTVPAGDTTTRTHFFTFSPCVDVVDPLVFVNPGGNVVLDDMTIYAWGVLATYSNATGGDETVTSVTIRGKTLELEGGSIVEVEDAASIASNSRQSLSEPVESEFWQTNAQALAAATSLLATYKDPRRDVQIIARGNPASHIGDRVKAPAYKDIVVSEYAVLSNDIRYDGGLEVSVHAQLVAGGASRYKKSIDAGVGAGADIDLHEINVRRTVSGAASAAAGVSRAVAKGVVANVAAAPSVDAHPDARYRTIVGGVAVGGSVGMVPSIWRKPISANVGVAASVSREADVTILSEAGDGYVGLYGVAAGSWSIAVDAAAGNEMDVAGNDLMVMAHLSSNAYFRRSYIYFKTSDADTGIDPGQSIDTVTLKIYINTYFTQVGGSKPHLCLFEDMPTKPAEYGGNPALSQLDYNKSGYVQIEEKTDADLGSTAYGNDPAPRGWHSFDIPVGYLNRSGMTKFMLATQENSTSFSRSITMDSGNGTNPPRLEIETA